MNFRHRAAFTDAITHPRLDQLRQQLTHLQDNHKMLQNNHEILQMQHIALQDQVQAELRRVQDVLEELYYTPGMPGSVQSQAHFSKMQSIRSNEAPLQPETP